MFIPYGDDGDSARRAPATWALIGLNAAAFFALGATGRLEGAIGRWGVVPADLDLFALVTSMFLHVGALHLAGNMLFLWIAGDDVEEKLGTQSFVWLYLGTGFVASFAYVAAHPRSELPLAGASGAISGVIAAYAVLCSHRRVKVFYWVWVRVGTFELAAGWAVGLWFAGQLFWAAVVRAAGPWAGAGVAFEAHIGGAVAGALAAWGLVKAGVVARDPDPELERAAGWASAAERGASIGRAPPPTPPEPAERVLRAIARVAQASEARPLEHGKLYEIILLVGDDRSVGRGAEAYARVAGEIPYDVRARTLRTGIIARGLEAGAARTALAVLRAARVAAAAVAVEAVPARAVVVRAVRLGEGGVEGAAGLEARPVTIGWPEIEAAEAVLESEGREVAIELLTAGTRYRLRTPPDLAARVALAIRDRAPSPAGVGRALRAVAAGRGWAAVVRELPASELAHVLGCLAALARLEREGVGEAASA